MPGISDHEIVITDFEAKVHHQENAMYTKRPNEKKSQRTLKNTLDEIKTKKELKYNISGIHSKHN